MFSTGRLSLANRSQLYCRCGSGESTYGFHQPGAAGHVSSSNRNTSRQPRSSSSARQRFLAAGMPCGLSCRMSRAHEGTVAGVALPSSTTTTGNESGVFSRTAARHLSSTSCRLCVVTAMPTGGAEEPLSGT